MLKTHKEKQRLTPVDGIRVIRSKYIPILSLQDWYDYHMQASHLYILKHQMNRDLRDVENPINPWNYLEGLTGYARSETNFLSVQLTLLAALEATIPDLGTRESLTIHFIGAAQYEKTTTKGMEELLHLLPALTALTITYIGPNTSDSFKRHPEICLALNCCADCESNGRIIVLQPRNVHYHKYLQNNDKYFRAPDLVVVLNSSFAVNDKEEWFPTIEYLAKRATHPTIFTSKRQFEVEAEVEVLRKLGAKFIKDP